MAYAPDRVPETHAYDPVTGTAYPPPTAARAFETPPAYREPAPARSEVTREVTAGPFRFGLREALLGILGLFTILGIVLAVLGFAAAFGLDAARDNAAVNNDAQAAADALPALLVSVLPFMAAPVLALGMGAWAGHASRNASIGAVAGGVGSFLGPILTLLIMGVGFALGAGAANLDLSNVDLPAFGIAPGWASTIPYLATGGGFLWLIANTLAGALSGGIIGGLLDGRWSARESRSRRDARRTTRY